MQMFCTSKNGVTIFLLPGIKILSLVNVTCKSNDTESSTQTTIDTQQTVKSY